MQLSDKFKLCPDWFWNLLIKYKWFRVIVLTREAKKQRKYSYMKLQDLLAQFSTFRVLIRMIMLYPAYWRNWRGFRQVLKVLRTKNKRNSEDVLCLKNVFDEGEKWVDVSSKDSKTREHFAISLTPWSQWLGMGIDLETLENFTHLDILCHCLWEMTFYGYEERLIKNMNKMLQYKS